MTKNSELIVMKACGVSLYRTAVPLLLFAAVWSAVPFVPSGSGGSSSPY